MPVRAFEVAAGLCIVPRMRNAGEWARFVESWWVVALVSCLPAGQVDVSDVTDDPEASVSNLDRAGSGVSLGATSGLVGMNAVMTVTALRGDGVVKQWRGQVAWRGEVKSYRGTVRGGVVAWHRGDDIAGLRVKTDIDGNGGTPLSHWLPASATSVDRPNRTEPGRRQGRGARQAEGEKTNADPRWPAKETRTARAGRCARPARRRCRRPARRRERATGRRARQLRGLGFTARSSAIQKARPVATAHGATRACAARWRCLAG